MNTFCRWCEISLKALLDNLWMGFATGILLLTTACINHSHNLNIERMLEHARGRSSGLVCNRDEKGIYCLEAFTQEHPQISFSFYDCLTRAKKEKTQEKKEAYAMWCVCMAGFGGFLNNLYNCGEIRQFKVYKYTGY